MVKKKIAISLDEPLLKRIDARVDHEVIRSRSQAIELFLRKGLEEQSINIAVLLIHKKHQRLAVRPVRGIALIKRQLEFFHKYDVKRVLIVTQRSRDINLLLKEVLNARLTVEIIEKDVAGNADALRELGDELPEQFIAMSGDIFMDFDLAAMMQAHFGRHAVATIGLMDTDRPSSYGNAILDGDSIVEFQEKPKVAKSHAVNAGIYIFSDAVFDYLGKKTSSIERDLLPALAREGKLYGFFTRGEYVHAGG